MCRGSWHGGNVKEVLVLRAENEVFRNVAGKSDVTKILMLLTCYQNLDGKNIISALSKKNIQPN